MKRREFAYGELNPVSLPSLRERLAPSNIIEALGKSFKNAYERDALSSVGPFRAVVLRVEKTSTTSPPDTWFSWIFPDKPPALERIRARIPEIHAMLPEPDEIGELVSEADARIIDMYPVFEAEDTTVPAPAVGDIVWVDFLNRENYRDPIYLGPILNAPSGNVSSLSGKSAKSYFAASKALKMEREMGSKIITSKTDEFVDYIIVNGVQRKIDAKVRHITEKRAAGLTLGYRARQAERPTMIVLHWDACTSADSCVNVLSQRRLGTHFVVDNDGSILQVFDPVPTVTYHAGAVNEVAVGIDLSNAVDKSYADWYEKHGFGRRPILDSRNTLGKPLSKTNSEYLGFYPVQIDAAKKLINLLCDTIGIAKQTPTEMKEIPSVANGEYRGVVGHLHVTSKKWDVAGFPFKSLFVTQANVAATSVPNQEPVNLEAVLAGEG